MSTKGNCYDNACAESFFHSLKVEAIHGERFATREMIRPAVFEYIGVEHIRAALAPHDQDGLVTLAGAIWLVEAVR